MEFIGFKRIGRTFAAMFYDKLENVVNSYFIQFSLVDMWKYPHREEKFNNGSWVYGWGFFYFGKITSRDKNA